VHPGYGFLAENAAFAQAVLDAGLIFIGPPAAAIEAMGDKIAARKVAIAAGIAPVPGTTAPVEDAAAAVEWASEHGYPVAVKASGGGGGRGFRVARTATELPEAFAGSRGEAERYFANPDVYLERYLEHPRHIEIQVFADAAGSVVAFPERDCSIQRRHQKLIEESPSPAVTPELRARLGAAAIALTQAVDYMGAGTIEFLLDADGGFYFLEMNTRIQVEHTITEMVTGVDLVREQIRVATGLPLSFTQDDLTPRGWAFEARINAEDAGRNFAPVSGPVTTYHAPDGFGVRVDAALGAGDEVSPQFDSLIAKLVVWGRDRDEALSRLRRTLKDFVVEGVPTTIPFHQRVAEHPAFIAGEATTTFLADYPDVLPPPAPAVSDDEAQRVDARSTLVMEVNGRRFDVVVVGNGAGSNDSRPERKRTRHRARSSPEAAATGAALISPVQGTVVRVTVEQGTQVAAGDVICVVEAMKMENELTAHRAGVVEELRVKAGGSVKIGEVIATIGE
jgi:acetyl-CoA/propionyl-CoA carboxylase biotin carboxyl carrier protein